MMPVRITRCPWLIEQAVDLCEANGGDLELTRDLVRDGRSERHIAMHVVGQFNRGISLGLLAVRCERQGARLVPLTVAIADTPITITRRPVMDMTLLSNPRRHVDGYRGDEDGA